MRTAMQLMVWYLENEGLEESGAYYKAKMLLEKEKEQIIDAWKDNREMIYYDIDKDELSETTKIELGKEYYNQTYNQNK
jgi:hypothetical protein